MAGSTAGTLRGGRDRGRPGCRGRRGRPGRGFGVGGDQTAILPERLEHGLGGSLVEDQAVGVLRPGDVRHGDERDAPQVHVPQPVRDLQQFCGSGEPLVDGQVAGHGVRDGVEPGDVRERALGPDLAGHRGEERLLGGDPSGVTAVTERVPGPEEGQGLVPLHLTGAGGERETGVLVLHRRVDAHLHPTERRGEFPDRVEVRHHEVVDGHPGEVVDGGDRTARTTLVEGPVQLGELHGARGLAGDGVDTARQGDQEIAGEGHDVDVLTVRGERHEHHDVRVVLVGILVLTPEVLTGVAHACVRAEDQDLQRIGARVHWQPLPLLLPEVQRHGRQVALQAVEVDTHEGHGTHEHRRHDQRDHRQRPERTTPAQMSARRCVGPGGRGHGITGAGTVLLA
nr:hypothetical protein [Arthrobacter sp. RIT-PI-e]